MDCEMGRMQTAGWGAALQANGLGVGVAVAEGVAVAVSVGVGVGVGVLQAATQINESSIGFLAKLVVLGLTLTLLGSWSMQNLVDYTQRTIGSIADVVR